MSDPNHFFHDMIEGVVIWEEGAKELSSPPIDVPAEASSVMDGHVDHHHDDPLQDAPEHSEHVLEVHASHAEDGGTGAVEHASDAHATEVAATDGDATSA